MLKNTKGMTLVEMIVTIAVFSIAALVLAAGFSTVIRYMGEASAIKNTSNEVYSIIESENSKDVTYEEVYFKIQLSDGNNVDNKINRVVAEKGISNDIEAYKVKYSKFTKEVGYVDTAKTFYEIVKKNLVEWKSNINWKDEYNKKLEKLENEKIDFNSIVKAVTNNSKGNTEFVNYFYITELNDVNNPVLPSGAYYPELDQEVIDKCNEIFDEMNGGIDQSSNVYKDARIGNKKMYMKCFYIADDDLAFLVADELPTNPRVSDSWRTKLIYNPDDGYWYYRVYKFIVGIDNPYDTSPYLYGIAKFNSNEKFRWNNLMAEFKDPTKWRKIELD